MQKSTELGNWDDLRVVLAVARAGSLSGAARTLGVEHSTVFRRINELESRLGAKLFERGRRGYLATAAGGVVVEAATAMEAETAGALRRLLGEDLTPAGPVRLATSELLACHLLPRLLPGILDDLPRIKLAVRVSNTPVDLDRREADLALRAQATPPEHLVGRRVANVQYAVFGAPSLLGTSPADLAALPWIGFEEAIAHYPNARWMHAKWPNARVVMRFDSTLAIQHAAAAGVGLGVLPIWAGSPDPRLTRLDLPSSDIHLPLWLLRHADVAQNARLRALTAWLAERIPAELDAMNAEGHSRMRAVLPSPQSANGHRA